MGVKTNKKISKVLHNSLKAVLLLPRGSFLLMVKWNIWGIAKIMNAVWGASKEIDYRWSIAWYNLGGDWLKLKKTAQNGKSKKPFGLNLAPKFIKSAYRKAGVSISGGIGEASTASILASAASIIKALAPLLQQLMASAGSLDEIPQEDEFATETSGWFNDVQNFPSVTDLPIITKEQAEVLKSGENLYNIPEDIIQKSKKSNGNAENKPKDSNMFLWIGAGVLGLMLLKK